MMDLQKMTIEELKLFQEGIVKEIKKREEMEIEKVTEEFLQVWKKMSKLGIEMKTDQIIAMGGIGRKVNCLNVEINGKLIEIYE